MLEPLTPFRRIFRLLQVVRRETGADFDKAAVLQIVGSLSEAFGVALLVPLMRLLGQSGRPLVLELAGRQISFSLPLLLGLFVLVIIARSFSLEQKERSNARVTFGFAERMTGKLFSVIAATRWSVVSNWRTSDMAQVVTGDGDRLLISINLLLSLVQAIAMTAILTVLSLLLSWQMTLLAAASSAALLVLTHPARKASMSQGGKLARARQLQFRLTEEFLGGLRTAKAFGLEAIHVASMKRILARIRATNERFMVSRARSTTLFQSLTAVALATFIYVATQVSALPMERIIALIFLYMRLAPRVMTIHGTAQELLNHIVGVENVLAMLGKAQKEAEVQVADNRAPLSLHDAITVQGVSYRYEGAAANSLADVSLTIPANSITAIVGPTGSGKSTFVDLILGLLEPTEGEIRIDGHKLEPARVAIWRDALAYVPQETFLFNATIAENLRLARRQASDDDIWAALAAADAAGFVRNLSDGLAHRVGDRGRSLSGGERQRLAIARALLRKPSLLILDEATSAIDPLSQRRVVAGIRAMCQGSMTVIAVAHRLGMVGFADNVVMIEAGRVIETGPPSALAARADSRIREMFDADANLTYMPL